MSDPQPRPGDPVFEPTIYGDSSAQEIKAAQQYVDEYGGSIDHESGDAPTGGSGGDTAASTPPNLDMIPVDVTFDATVGGSGSGTGNDTPKPLQPLFKISLPDLLGTVQTIQGSTAGLVGRYKALQELVTKATVTEAGWFWGQTVGQYEPNLPQIVGPGPDGAGKK